MSNAEGRSVRSPSSDFTSLGDRQMKTYQYKPDAQASAFHRHAENACTRLRVGLVLAVQPVGSLLPIALLHREVQRRHGRLLAELVFDRQSQHVRAGADPLRDRE